MTIKYFHNPEDVYILGFDLDLDVVLTVPGEIKFETLTPEQVLKSLN